MVLFDADINAKSKGLRSELFAPLHSGAITEQQLLHTIIQITVTNQPLLVLAEVINR